MRAYSMGLALEVTVVQCHGTVRVTHDSNMYHTVVGT